MSYELFLILGLVTLSAALRSFDHTLLRKLGTVGIMAASFVAGWLLTGQWWVGVIMVFSWFLLPWLEILTRVRSLRLPLEKSLRHRRPPSEELFPALENISEEIVDDGFVLGDDLGWDWDDYQQFFRLFYKAAERCQSVLCVTEQNALAFCYMNIQSRGKDGQVWTTWNYPFSYSLKVAPQVQINRVRSNCSFQELYAEHREWLRKHAVTTEDLEELDPDDLGSEVQKDLRRQIAHNLSEGVLLETAEGEMRYSWRGLCFIYVQFLRDLVRL